MTLLSRLILRVKEYVYRQLMYRAQKRYVTNVATHLLPKVIPETGLPPDHPWLKHRWTLEKARNNAHARWKAVAPKKQKRPDVDQ